MSVVADRRSLVQKLRKRAKAFGIETVRDKAAREKVKVMVEAMIALETLPPDERDELGQDWLSCLLCDGSGGGDAHRFKTPHGLMSLPSRPRAN